MHALQTGGSPIKPARSFPSGRCNNALLLSLSPTAYCALRDELRLYDAVPHEVLWSGDSETVFFPLAGAISVAQWMPGSGPDSSRFIEVAIVGRESAVMAGDKTRGMTWTGGPVAKISSNAFMAICSRHPEIAELMRKAADWQLFQARVLVACTARHSVDSRVARWLVTMAARVGERAIMATQEDIGETALGVRRTTVTLTMQGFAEDRIIGYRRGVIRIRDLKRLRAASCECHTALCPASP